MNNMFHIMWNRQIYETESELLDRVVAALAGRLPASWRVGETRRPKDRERPGPDAVIRLRGPDGRTSEVVLEVKRRIDPKDVLGVVARARRIAGERAIWFVAPFLSPGTRERLRHERVGYLDSTGNMWLSLEKPALFVETTGADRDPQRASRALSSLKGRAAGRVVRALCDYKPPYGIRELAKRSRTTLSSLSRVAALLDREAILVRDSKGGITDVNVESLIRRWTQDYAILTSNKTETFLEPRGLESLVEKLRNSNQRYIVTGSLAAVFRVSVAVPRLAVVYVEDARAAANDLVLKPAETGANVILARPFDPVVYERGERLDGVYYAAPSQVAADLLTSPGRGPSEGEELMLWMKLNAHSWRS